jgi:hypothetical protein
VPRPRTPPAFAALCIALADTMPVSLTLKRKGAYTNLDYVEGDVNFDISSSETIESIVVKVEGTAKHALSCSHQRDFKDYDICQETGQRSRQTKANC